MKFQTDQNEKQVERSCVLKAPVLIKSFESSLAEESGLCFAELHED